MVALLNRLASTHLSEHFRVVGTHALYAYRSRRRVRLEADALATRDIDLLWDTRKRNRLFYPTAKVDGSMLGVLKKWLHVPHPANQKYTAVNKTALGVCPSTISIYSMFHSFHSRFPHSSSIPFLHSTIYLIFHSILHFLHSILPSSPIPFSPPLLTPIRSRPAFRNRHKWIRD